MGSLVSRMKFDKQLNPSFHSALEFFASKAQPALDSKSNEPFSVFEPFLCAVTTKIKNLKSLDVDTPVVLSHITGNMARELVQNEASMIQEIMHHLFFEPESFITTSLEQKLKGCLVGMVLVVEATKYEIQGFGGRRAWVAAFYDKSGTSIEIVSTDEQGRLTTDSTLNNPLNGRIPSGYLFMPASQPKKSSSS